MSYRLDKSETSFFIHIQSQECRTVEIGQIGPSLGLTPPKERKLLSKLSRRGLIARVRRGLYLVPPRLPPGGKWTPSEALALAELMADCSGQYQICGMNTFNRYGWDEQVPNRLYVYNNRLSGSRQIGAVSIALIKVSDERLGSVDTVTLPDGLSLRYSSKARALMDAVYDWSRFSGLPRAYDWISKEIAADDAMAAKLVNVSLRYGNQGTLRRIGALLEREGVVEPLLRKVGKGINKSSSRIPWVPTKPKRGKISKRWGVILNHE